MDKVLLSLILLAVRPCVSAYLHDSYEEDQADSRDRESKLFRRFWNDDLEACILKYCLQFQGEGYAYMKCIRKHCPAGLVTVPRDLEFEDLPSTQISQLQQMCVRLLCNGDTDDIIMCAQKKCELQSNQLGLPDSDTPKIGDQEDYEQSVLANTKRKGLVDKGGYAQSSMKNTALDRKDQLWNLLDELLEVDDCASKKCSHLVGVYYTKCLKQLCDKEETKLEGPSITKRRVNSALILCLSQHDGQCSGMARRDCLTRYCGQK